MILTERLVLRRWQRSDRAPFAALNGDPRVMKHFPATLSRAESDAIIHDRIAPHFERYGFGLWAVERRSDQAFLGFTGLAKVEVPCPFEGEVEIGWRLARNAWGQGYALEAATAALAYGFGPLGLAQIFAMTIERNVRSRRLMDRLGLARMPGLDFEHPKIAPGDPTRRQIVYVASGSKSPLQAQNAY